MTDPPRVEGKGEPRKLDKTAWVTGFPLAVLVLAEFWTLLDRRPGGTVTETVRWALGDYARPWYWLLSGAIVGFLLWMALHFVHDPGVWGWRQLIVLTGGCVLTGAWLYIVK